MALSFLYMSMRQLENFCLQVLRRLAGLKGKTVRNRHGPAAVTGDEVFNRPLAEFRLGRRKPRMIRESENLPASKSPEIFLR